MASIIKNVGGHLVVSGGRKDAGYITGSSYRTIGEFEPMAKTTRAIDTFLTVMLDKRAPGLWNGIIGGPKSKIEHLAEIAVNKGLVSEIASTLLDNALIRDVNERLVRNNQRFKQGVLSIDYTSLFKAVSTAIGAGSSADDPKRHVARILVEILSRAYTQIGVMVPFVGAIDLKYEQQPIADTDMIIKAANIATVSEIFEAIEIGSALKDAKEFNPSVAESLLGPLMVTAANRLLSTIRYDNYMRDTATLVGRYLMKSTDLPDHVRDNADLAYLASNASFALGSVAMASRAITTPDFDLREAITYTVMRIRELRRFESISLDKFAEMYSHTIVHAPSGRIAGVFIKRNEEFKLDAQVTKFVSRGDFVLQAAVPVAEAYLAPITESITRAFAGGILGRTVEVAASNLLTRKWETSDESAGGGVFAYDVSDAELQMYAIALADRLFISPIYIGDEDGPTDGARILYETSDTKAFYEPKGFHGGTAITVDDPAELLILTAADRVGTASFIKRPQSILDDLRKSVLSELDEEYMIDLSKPVKMDLPTLSGFKMSISTSMQDLLGLSSLGEIYLTKSIAAAEQVDAAFTALSYVYTELAKSSDSIDKLLAHQVAVATHSLIANVASSDSFRRVMQTLFVRFMQDAQNKTAGAGKDEASPDKNALRTHLASAFVQHQLALSTASMLLLKTGILHYGVQGELSKMFVEEEVVEVAITAETWHNAMKPMTV